MTTPKQPVHLGGAILDRSRHVCAFFNSRDEEYRTLLPYIKEGFDHGDKAYHIVESSHRPRHRRVLQGAGIDTAAAEARGQLDIRAWEDAYLRDGRFSQDRMLALIQQVLDAGRAQGYPLTRLVANMEWALEDRPGVEDLVEYETRLNYVLPKYDDAVCWTYDLARFGASTAMDIMRTHPMVLMGGILRDNPFFVPPDEMLRELKLRKNEPKPDS